MGNGISNSLDLRVAHPVKRNGKELMITTLKSHADDKEEARTIKRTIDGEKAALQVKWTKHQNELEMVHIHCLTDKESSEWGKSSGLPIESLYDLTQQDGGWKITCKKCGRTWNTSGSDSP